MKKEKIATNMRMELEIKDMKIDIVRLKSETLRIKRELKKVRQQQDTDHLLLVK